MSGGPHDTSNSWTKNEAVNTRSQRLRVGLTGGIASGKTTVANMFAELGVAIIDTDVIARSVVEPGEPAMDEIQRIFGPEVILSDGALDRKRLRAIVFSDGDQRARLEAILHPRIRTEANRLAAEADSDYHIVVVPLLAESPMKADMHRVLVVDCSEEIQLARLLERDAESEDQARRMIASQVDRSTRLEMADDVVSNEGDLAVTRQQVIELHTLYLSLADNSKAT